MNSMGASMTNSSVFRARIPYYLTHEGKNALCRPIFQISPKRLLRILIPMFSRTPDQIHFLILEPRSKCFETIAVSSPDRDLLSVPPCRASDVVSCDQISSKLWRDVI
jgi:hypothetical protein